MKLSNAQVDRLGERLRKGPVVAADLVLLDEYRLSFDEAFRTVVRKIEERLKFRPTGRPAKSTLSIIDKLKRESIRLSQMQDIAGCRVVAANQSVLIDIQDELEQEFPGAAIIDRIEKPSHGYRAIHLVPKIEGRRVEIQLRTARQHSWAQLIEMLSDSVDSAVKYGGGDPLILRLVSATSFMFYIDDTADLARSQLAPGLENPRKAELERLLEDVQKKRLVIAKTVRELYSEFVEKYSIMVKGQKGGEDAEPPSGAPPTIIH